MNANSLGLLNSLADILNAGKRDSDYAIACYLIAHIDGLSGVSITDIMTEAFVTRSAVRRFCNRIGFMSFSDFKSHMTVASYPSDLNHRDTRVDIAAYRADLDRSIASSLRETSAAVSNEAIVGLARDLHDFEHVTLACANNTSGILGRFQQELFYVRKVVHIVSDIYQDRLADVPAGERQLLIVVSASGVFARSLEGWIQEIPAQKYLVTAIAESVDTSLYDRVYRLNRTRINYDRLGLFGKYGISYFFDLLSACYLNLYA